MSDNKGFAGDGPFRSNPILMLAAFFGGKMESKILSGEGMGVSPPLKKMAFLGENFIYPSKYFGSIF